MIPREILRDKIVLKPVASLEAGSMNASKEQSLVANLKSSITEPNSSNQVTSYIDPGKGDDTKRELSEDSTFERT
jgi:hypothetical protein